MKNSRFDDLKSPKKLSSSSSSPSLDENSKKIQKLRIKLNKSKNMSKSSKTSSKTLTLPQIDMKSVRVLVERTKFNVMFNHKLVGHKNSPKSPKTSKLSLSSSKSSPTISRLELKKSPLKKLSNTKTVAPLASSTPQRVDSVVVQKKSTTTTTPNQPTIDGIFKIRKCCIKLPKDKNLLQMQQNQIPYPVKLIVHHKSRGRPRKFPAILPNDGNNSLMVDSPLVTSSGQKRKSSEKSPSLSPPKRKIKKGNEFFIKIGALTRTPSPRRKPASNSCSPEEKPPQNSKQRRKVDKKLNKKALTSTNLAPLRQKFGSRYFKSFVKIKRIGPNWETCPTPPKIDTTPFQKKKNGKNLSVSFLETVEIFGESSDDDDWFDADPKNSKRTIPLDNLFDSLKATSTSTPSIKNNSGSILKSSILDRKEKSSFSPLKEHESPRKEQLKLANESFVRRSLDTQMQDDEERDIGEDLTESEPAKESSTVPESGIVDDKEHNSIESSPKSSNETSESSQTQHPVLPDNNEDEDQTETEKEEQKEGPQNSSNNSLESNNESSIPAAEKSNEQDQSYESFKSADATLDDKESNKVNSQTVDETLDVDETQNLSTSANEEEDDEKEADNTTEVEHRGDDKKDDEDTTNEDNTTNQGEEHEDASNQQEETNQEDDQNVEEANENPANNEEPVNENEISKEDVCPDDEEEEIEEEEPFVDPSKLVASVLLNDSTEEERNEAEAVLNDVCQMAAAESVVLLNPVAHLAYSSPHSAIDDDDDDFNSVLTHPETEKTLQSTAASALVPSSQEIAVESAVVASQAAALVAPADVDVTEDTFASVVAEVERFTKDVVNSEIYSADVGITGADVMMDNVQARHSLDDIFDDDDVDDDLMSSLRMSSGSIDIGHHKSLPLPIQVIETEVMAIPNEPDIIFDKSPIVTTASSINSVNDTLPVHCGPTATSDSNKKLFGRLFQSVKSYVMSPGADKNSSLQD
ncbi:transcriptional regulator ATRX-like isoform X2 [Episyrphus balteatus]|uniref:transcriptional regulator ATRX-like isoform X2 n=1 Tax=Episyrphus balteatus TaxID=286459 RepID=UPI002485FB9F|nr:transcriptional regulator ATRX-like isoform X2 [Episyrphus balteatus]